MQESWGKGPEKKRVGTTNPRQHFSANQKETNQNIGRETWETNIQSFGFGPSRTFGCI